MRCSSRSISCVHCTVKSTCGADTGDAGAGKAASAAKVSLQRAITWCTTDAAGPSLALLRGALLDLASVLLAEGALPHVLACLQAAATVGTCRDSLQMAPQSLGAVTATAIPTWAVQLLQGVLALSHNMTALGQCATAC